MHRLKEIFLSVNTYKAAAFGAAVPAVFAAFGAAVGADPASFVADMKTGIALGAVLGQAALFGPMTGVSLWGPIGHIKTDESLSSTTVLASSGVTTLGCVLPAALQHTMQYL